MHLSQSGGGHLKSTSAAIPACCLPLGQSPTEVLVKAPQLKEESEIQST